MIIPRKEGDLNIRYRPCTFAEMLGNENIKRMLSNAVKQNNLPHAMLFTGPSGCGKTTAARIIALTLNCKAGPVAGPCFKCDPCKSILDLNSFGVLEVDAARTGDVATIRGILDSLPAAPLGEEKYKVLIIDEAHNLVPPSKSEEALLKFLEDTPPHVYIILCTNEPRKLKEVTRNRCKLTQFGRLENRYIYELLEQVCQFEGFEYKKEILNYIVEESNGVPRQALTYLQQISSEGSWEKDVASLIINAGIETDQIEVFEFCKVLLKGGWKNVLGAFKKIKNIPPETTRIIVTGFMAGCLRNSKNIEEAKQFSKTIDIISVPYYGPKQEHVLLNNLFKILTILQGRKNV